MSESKSNTMYYIHCAIGCILMFLFRFLPAPAPITSLGMQMIGIFIGLIYMWSFVDTLWPSVMGLFALCLSDYGTTTSIIASSFGNSTSALMLLFLALVAVIEECDLAGYLSNRFLSIKKFAGRPWLFTLCWLIVVAAMSSCCNMFLIAFTFWAVFYKICDQTGIQKGEAYASLMIIGTLVFAAIGSIIMPFNGIALIANAAYANMGREGVVYLYYIPMVAIMILAMIIGYVGIMRFIFRADVSKLAHLDLNKIAKEKQPMTKQQKTLLIILLGAIALLLMPGIVPATNAFGIMINKLSTVGIVLGVFSLLSFIRIDGKPLLSFSKAAATIPWNLWFIITCAMVISGALTSEGTGVKEFVLQHLTPIIANTSPWVFTILLAVIAVILTNIANNIVVCLTLISVLAMYASAYSLNEPVALTIIMVCACLGYLLPSSSVTGALMHGNPWLSAKEIYKYIFVVLIWMTFCVIAIGIPLGMLFY